LLLRILFVPFLFLSLFAHAERACLPAKKDFDFSNLGLYKSPIGSTDKLAQLNFVRVADYHHPHSVPFYISFELSKFQKAKLKQDSVSLLVGDRFGMVLCFDEYEQVFSPNYKGERENFQKFYEDDSWRELTIYKVKFIDFNVSEDIFRKLKIEKIFYKKKRSFWGGWSGYIIDHKDVVFLSFKNPLSGGGLDSITFKRFQNKAFKKAQTFFNSVLNLKAQELKKIDNGLGILGSLNEECRVQGSQKIQEILSTSGSKTKSLKFKAQDFCERTKHPSE